VQSRGKSSRQVTEVGKSLFAVLLAPVSHSHFPKSNNPKASLRVVGCQLAASSRSLLAEALLGLPL